MLLNELIGSLLSLYVVIYNKSTCYSLTTILSYKVNGHIFIAINLADSDGVLCEPF